MKYFIVVKLRAGSEADGYYRVQSFYIDTDCVLTYETVLDWLHRVNKNNELDAGDIEAMWECDSMSDMDLWADALRYTLGEFDDTVTRRDMLKLALGTFACASQHGHIMPQYPMSYIEYLESIKEAASND